MTTKLVLVGGFLGAGKTTLLLESARRLAAEGLRVGLVTNDQGKQLVDTALGSDADIPVTEVADGCFCCRFPDLIKALRKLQRSVQPDVILAEPVGSCTDLVATVLRPLRYYYPAQFDVAPLTVLVSGDHDPSGFSERVRYLHEKQAAEADFILLSKADLLSAPEAANRMASLRSQYPGAQILPVSAQDGTGIDAWWAALSQTTGRLQRALEIDYAAYAEAEAELGWLNMRGAVSASAPFSPEAWMEQLLSEIGRALAGEQATTAHLKMRLQTPCGVFKAGMTTNLGDVSWHSREAGAVVDRAQFVLNLRAAGPPSLLETSVRTQLEDAGSRWQMRCDIDHFECFRPAPPQPTHRLDDSQPPTTRPSTWKG